MSYRMNIHNNFHFSTMGDDTDDLAASVAEAVKSGDFWSAVALMGGLSAAEVQAVTAKAIALGADPDMMAQIAASLGKTEVIEVTGKPPAGPSFPLWGFVAIGGLAWLAYEKWGKKL